MRKQTFWLFVRVIDHFGDAGVAHRLSCQLRAMLDAHVVLWIDEVATLEQLAPDVMSSDLDVRLWQDGLTFESALAFEHVAPPDVVIELFGCDLPNQVIDYMKVCRPVWLNFEYLSAETWARDMHLMPSIQPFNMTKYFWFMGFDEASGGLLREEHYLPLRDHFTASSAAQDLAVQTFNLPAKTRFTVLIFAYVSKAWAKIVAAWLHNKVAFDVWLCGDAVLQSIEQFGAQFGLPAPQKLSENSYLIGNIQFFKLPFVPQPAFDQLLWLADVSFVRGEDSFVRANLAGKPFFWQPYIQENQAHHDKLTAFHAYMLPALDEASAALACDWEMVSLALSEAVAVDVLTLAACFMRLRASKAWLPASCAWSNRLCRQPSTLQKLARFLKDQVK